jgi:hypothetical protein
MISSIEAPTPATIQSKGDDWRRRPRRRHITSAVRATDARERRSPETARDMSRNGDRPFLCQIRLKPTCRSLKRSLATYIRSSQVVVRGGVEPPTFRFSGGRSYQLSYLTESRAIAGMARGRAVLTGFEPATSTLTGWRALQAALQDPVVLAGTSAPNGIRTRAAALKGRCPRPLDDGGSTIVALPVASAVGDRPSIGDGWHYRQSGFPGRNFRLPACPLSTHSQHHSESPQVPSLLMIFSAIETSAPCSGTNNQAAR